MNDLDPRVLRSLEEHPYPLLFATVSGAHLYGFPSPDSDYDLRGVHLLPLAEVLSLRAGRETVEVSGVRDGLEIDLVTHDVRKFFALLLRKNGYVLEQLLSPLVLCSSPEHQELRSLAPGLVTRHHAHHYLGFATTQGKLLEKESPPRAKPLLYVYRVLLTGIHLMRAGEVEANLPRLADEYDLPQVADLIERKCCGEQTPLSSSDVEYHREACQSLRARLESEYAASQLPDRPRAAEAVDDLLVRLRMSKRAC